ncbi:hypothetical protein [Halovenus marina]|uniref:hypothetical protein n=1 Tax=Halovenus marina TaxID=3396621 RepID=UPI003F577F29
MSGWQARVDELLYDGESVRDSLELDSAQVVVTSHRVIAFTPDLDGENFQQVDRPNVTGVEASASANDSLLSRVISTGAIGLLLVAVGYAVDFESILGDAAIDGQTSTGTGLGSVIQTTRSMLDIVAQLDEMMRLLGALALLFAVALFGVYWLGRDPTLLITTAGDTDDIRLPRPENVAAARSRLEAAIFPDDVDRSAGSEGLLGDHLP